MSMPAVDAKPIKSPKLIRYSSISDNSDKLSEIYNEKVNISIWKRKINAAMQKAAQEIFSKNPDLRISVVPQPQDAKEVLLSELGKGQNAQLLIEDISKLVNLFCNLFNLKRAWIRLDAINKPMCPRFHADKLKCRMVTTYKGPATQWIPHHLINRTMLGHGNNGLPDEESGIFEKSTDIEQLDTGHVALLKGESWDGNQGAGLIHRSPHSKHDYSRLYMTIDFEETYLSIYKKNNRISYS